MSTISPRHPSRVLFSVCVCLFLFIPLAVLAQQPNVSGTPQSAASIQNPVDPALASWQAKDKYFLTVAATKTAGQDTALPYAKVDGNKVSAVLLAKGYKKIEALTDKTATRENFIESLKRIRVLKENGLVIVYYSGHGAIDPEGRDLWLQLYGQQHYGESQGLSVGELIRIARGGVYKGELVVIIDACYSGQGAWTESLSLNQVENTLIFASNSRTQESFPIDISPTETISAFTYYLLRGLTDDWDTVDEKHQGIVLYEDLRTYVEMKLTELLVKKGQPEKEMTPEISGQPGKIWAAFDPKKAQNLQTLLRQALGFRNYLRSQLPNVLQPQGMRSAVPPAVSLRARELAERVPANADSYTKALKAIAENRNADALRLLDQAEKDNAAELTDVYQARGSAKIYEGQFLEGKEWYEKALRVNRKENPELLEEASMVFVMVSDLNRAEALLKQALEIRDRGPKADVVRAWDLMGLGTLKFIQGKYKEAENYLQAVQAIDPKILDSEDEGLSILPRFLMLVVKFIQGEMADAEKLAVEFASTPQTELDQGDPLRTVALFIVSIVYSETGRKADFELTAARLLESWEQAVVDEDLEKLSFYTGFVLGLGSGGVDLFPSGSKLATRLESVSEKTLQLARRNSGASSAELAMCLSSLAFSRLIQRNYPEAESLFVEAINVSHKALGEHNFLDVINDHALGKLYEDQRRFEEAEQAFKKSLAMAESLTGQTSILAMMSIEDLADLYEKQERYQEAVPYYERAWKAQSVEGETVPIKLSVLYGLSRVYEKLDRHAEAEKLLKQALAGIKSTNRLQDPRLMSILVNLGELYFAQEKYKEAEPSFLRAVSIEEDNQNEEAANLAASLLWLSETYLAEGKADDANKASKRLAIVSGRLVTGDQKDALAHVLFELGNNHKEHNKPNDAQRVYQQLLKLYDKVDENVRPPVAVYLYSIAQFFASRRQYGDAERTYLRTIYIDERSYGKENIEVAIDLEGLAECYRLMEKYDDAISLYLRSIPIREKSHDLALLARSLSNLALIYIDLNKYADAERYITRSIEILEKSSVVESWAYAECLARLAIIKYELNKNYPESEKLLRRALTINQHLPQTDPWTLATDFRLLANVYRFQGKYDEAEKALFQSRENSEKAYGPLNLGTARVLFNLVLVYRAASKDSKAESSLTGAIELSKKLSPTDQVDLASWLEYYASAMRYMQRDSEATELAGWAREVRKASQR